MAENSSKKEIEIMEITKELIRKYDPGKVYDSVVSLSKQAEDAWEETKNINIGRAYAQVNNIVMCGMGGSGLAARVIESVYADDLKIPLIRVNSYNLPGFVNENSLVICSSYSGTTEETIENAKQAISKKAKWMAIGTGNTLIEMAKKNKAPYYQIDPVFNPSKQPRMAIGYSITGQLILAAKTGIISFTEKDISEAVLAMKQVWDKNKIEVDISQNPAKQTAAAIRGKITVYVSAGHLAGAAHVINNQQNENAKSFSADVQIPELNHHLMEGLKHPESNRSNLYFVFINSTLYPERINQRMAITKEVVAKQGIGFCEINLEAGSGLPQAFELIQLGGMINLYLSVLYEQNPAPIPWVDYFKERLGQPLGK